MASKALGDDLTRAVLADLDGAPIDERLRGTIRFVEAVTVDPNLVGADEVLRLAALGVARQDLEDALAVAYCFNLITRLADAFGWRIPEQAGFEASADSLLAHGYLMPLRGKPDLAD